MAQAGKDGGSKEVLKFAKRGAKGKRNDGVQLRPPHRDGWTAQRKAEFIEVLRATCNVQEGLRAVGMSSAGVYYQRKHDPQFAAGWDEAIEQGYVELEMMLLRQSIFGSETTETIDDGRAGGRKRTKTIHSYPHAIALRLFLARRDTVAAYRQQQGIEQADSDAVRAEIRRRLALMRERAAEDESEEENGERDG